MIFDDGASNYIQACPSRVGERYVEVSINDPYEHGASIRLTDDQVDQLIEQLQAAKKARE